MGRRPSLEEMSALTGLPSAAIDELPEHLRKDAETIRVRANRGDLTADLQQVLAELEHGEDSAARDTELIVALSELRLVKDAFEADEMRVACARTAEASCPVDPVTVIAHLRAGAGRSARPAPCRCARGTSRTAHSRDPSARAGTTPSSPM